MTLITVESLNLNTMSKPITLEGPVLTVTLAALCLLSIPKLSKLPDSKSNLLASNATSENEDSALYSPS